MSHTWYASGPSKANRKHVVNLPRRDDETQQLPCEAVLPRSHGSPNQTKSLEVSYSCALQPVRQTRDNLRLRPCGLYWIWLIRQRICRRTTAVLSSPNQPQTLNLTLEYPQTYPGVCLEQQRGFNSQHTFEWCLLQKAEQSSVTFHNSLWQRLLHSWTKSV